MRAAGAHHVAITARDVDCVTAFYRDVLGLEELVRHHDESGRLRSVWLDCQPMVLMIERAEAPTAAADEPVRGSDARERPGLHLLAFRIRGEDAARWREHLAARGHPVAHATAHTLYVRDPEGNRVGLSSYAF